MSGIFAGAVLTATPVFAEPAAPEARGPRVEIAQASAAAARVASGFDAALAGTISHPSELLAGADTRALATALLGEMADDFLYALTGPGGVERRGDVFVGNACHPDDCALLQVLVLVDTAERRVYVGWQNRLMEAFRPSEHSWPIEGQDYLVGWRNDK
ncbi:MAG: hypothetical protein IT534_08380 [Bauldia sp.]|nr:hypothetical protein [Bauldia sp.]